VTGKRSTSEQCPSPAVPLLILRRGVDQQQALKLEELVGSFTLPDSE